MAKPAQTIKQGKSLEEVKLMLQLPAKESHDQTLPITKSMQTLLKREVSGCEAEMPMNEVKEPTGIIGAKTL